MSTCGRRLLTKSGTALALVVIAAAVHAGPATAQQPPPPPQPPGRDIAAVARANGRAESEVRRLLADPAVRVGAKDRIFYVDPLPAEGVASAGAPPAASVPYSETFLLHSRPGAQRTIFLDFDGHQITDTAWTGAYGAPADFFASEYTLDASPSFSTAEQDAIQSVWQRVSEDFASFNVDVTTQDPGADAIDRNGIADQVYGTRALITNTTYISGSCRCGGIAYLDVFDDPYDHAYYQPAFVFPTNLGRDAKSIAEAASHEVGHNLDLVHDGTATVGYYGGHGAWAPIMGVGYNRAVSQWSKGEYAGANTQQDDLAIIALSGAPLLADDHGNTSAAATAVAAGPTVTASGVTTTDADVDVFRVDASGGTATFSASPAAVSPNLDIALELRDGTGAVLAASDPPSAVVTRDSASGLSASLSASLPSAGAYYLFVSGAGFGDPASTGYSDYGSIGRYTVSGETPQAAPPTLSIADTSVTEGNSGPTVATFTVTRTGATAGTSTVNYRTSTSGTATAGSDYTAVPTTTLTFAPGETTKTVTVNVAGDVVAEVDEIFYVTLSAPTAVTVTDATGVGKIVNDDALPTLAVADTSVTEGNSGRTVATFTVTRSGGTAGSSTVKYRTATSGTATSGTDYTAVAATTVAFAPGETTRTVTVNVTGDAVAEADETFCVTLSAPTVATVADATGMGKIVNDDALPTLAAGDTSVTEGNVGTTLATFTVTRSGPTAGSSTVRYRTSTSGTATAGSDYTAVPTTTLTFAPGETTKTVTVNVTGDGVVEADETFYVTLSAPTVATVSDPTGAGRILNDD